MIKPQEQRDEARIWGYAKGWPDETREDITNQVNALIEAGAEEVVLEYKFISSKAIHPRKKLLEMVHPGDTIIALEASRICGGLQELWEFIQLLQTQRLRLMLIRGIIVDFRENDPMSNAYLEMVKIAFEIEEEVTRRQQRADEMLCRAHRDKIGRPRTTIEDIPAQFIKFFPLLLEKKMNISQLARVCKLSRPTVYKYLRLIGNAAETLEDENGKEE